MAVKVASGQLAESVWGNLRAIGGFEPTPIRRSPKYFIYLLITVLEFLQYRIHIHFLRHNNISHTTNMITLFRACPASLMNSHQYPQYTSYVPTRCPRYSQHCQPSSPLHRLR